VGDKRVVLRGTTADVIDEIPDAALDFAYIDGDHTLRGITIDLVKVFPKVRAGGWIGADDFSPSIWQQAEAYEPTLVFPLAVHFAEAAGARIFGLPHQQFLIEKAQTGHEFVDLTGRYGTLDLRSQLIRPASAGPRRRRVSSPRVGRGLRARQAGQRAPAAYNLSGNITKTGGLVMASSDRGTGGITLGGIIVIVGIVLMIVWSFWIGLIIALIGLIAFGGFARGKWY
jgi:hypothetical protein